MLPEALRGGKTLRENVPKVPGVSIIIPFEPKMEQREDIEYRLQRVLENVEKELLQKYEAGNALPVLDKLKAQVKGLNFSTYKKSVAIFASPLIDKLFYLDMPVEEKIIIDEGFEIRDLVYSKKEIHKYLILVLSGDRSRLFLGNTTQFLRIASNTPENAAAYRNDVPERVGNFSDPSKRKEVLLDKFLRHIDNALGHVLNAYRLPLFVMATEKTAGHFKMITHHAHRIIGWVHGNFDDATEADIRKIIAPHVADWKKVLQLELLQKLDSAMGAQKLAVGMQEVWDAVNNGNGSLLVVEKHFMYPVKDEGGNKKIFGLDEALDRNPPVRDVVEVVIEKVLENGGDVEFVDEDILTPYQQIALVKYF